MAEQSKPSNFVVRTDNLNEDEGPLFRPAEGIEVVWDTVPVSQRLKELEAEVEKWKVEAATAWQGQEAGSEWNRELRAENDRLEAELTRLRALVGEQNEWAVAHSTKTFAFRQAVCAVLSLSPYSATDEEVCESIAHLRAVRDALTEALRFYADESNYDEEGVPGKAVYSSGVYGEYPEYDFDPDMGERARKALLAAQEEAEHGR